MLSLLYRKSPKKFSDKKPTALSDKKKSNDSIFEPTRKSNISKKISVVNTRSSITNENLSGEIQEIMKIFSNVNNLLSSNNGSFINNQVLNEQLFQSRNNERISNNNSNNQEKMFNSDRKNKCTIEPSSNTKCKENKYQLSDTKNKKRIANISGVKGKKILYKNFHI